MRVASHRHGPTRRSGESNCEASLPIGGGSRARPDRGRPWKVTMTGFSLKHASLAAMAAAVAAAAGGPATAQPQMVCGERDAIVAQLERKYGETRRSVGLQQGRALVEVYASEKTGSWTILVTDTAGKSCLMATGEAFETLKVAEAESAI